MISVLTLNACRYLWQWIHIVRGRLSSNAFLEQKVAGENSSSSYRALESGVQGLMKCKAEGRCAVEKEGHRQSQGELASRGSLNLFLALFTVAQTSDAQ